MKGGENTGNVCLRWHLLWRKRKKKREELDTRRVCKRWLTVRTQPQHTAEQAEFMLKNNIGRKLFNVERHAERVRHAYRRSSPAESENNRSPCNGAKTMPTVQGSKSHAPLSLPAGWRGSFGRIAEQTQSSPLPSPCPSPPSRSNWSESKPLSGSGTIAASKGLCRADGAPRRKGG